MISQSYRRSLCHCIDLRRIWKKGIITFGDNVSLGAWCSGDRFIKLSQIADCVVQSYLKIGLPRRSRCDKKTASEGEQPEMAAQR